MTDEDMRIPRDAAPPPREAPPPRAPEPANGSEEARASEPDPRLADAERRYAELSARALVAPEADAGPEAWDSFYARLGRPAKAEEYDFALPEGLPPDMPYDSGSAQRYKAWSHAAGLTPKQAQSLHDAFVRDQAERYAELIDGQKERARGAHLDLTTKWGEASSRGYAESLGYANRFIANNGGESLMAEMREHGILARDGAVLSPILVRALAIAGKALYGEDGLANGAPTPRPADPARTLYPNDPFSARR